MQIAIVGPGRIGSTFAYLLSRAGHQVTVVARGKRLEVLEREGAIVTTRGDRAPIQVAKAVDPAVPFDLILVTVLAPQVGELLPALSASAARSIMFMFNTFEPLDPLRSAVGDARFSFGFPAMLAHFIDDKLQYEIFTKGQITTVTDPKWAKCFTDAGIYTVVHHDMHSWLRTHAAFVAPFMAISVRVVRSGRGLSFAEAADFARAWRCGFRVVRELGHPITPGLLTIPGSLPTALLTLIFWGMSRLKAVREAGMLGPAEAQMLIDQMTAAAPGKTEALLKVRP